MTKKWCKMYEFSKEKGNYPINIQELSKFILKEDRKNKLKKLANTGTTIE